MRRTVWWSLPAAMVAVAVAGLIVTHASHLASPASPSVGRAGTQEGAASRRTTAHYAIASFATAEQTTQVADAVEALHGAFLEFFPGVPSQRPDGRKLQLVLYRDQAHFKANNRSKPWAEAYYRPPTCFAYYAVGERNPYHWMLHEATHQLHHELAGFSRAQWLGEGLASYFGASRIVTGTLMPGTVDAGAYPIWWLPSLALSGDLDRDIAQRRIIPLRALIEGTGPPIAQQVNLYYIEFWSLTHFLLHHDQGRYAKAYRTLLEGDGTLAEFEAAVGPVERVQAEWYAHLRAQVSALR